MIVSFRKACVNFRASFPETHGFPMESPWKAGPLPLFPRPPHRKRARSTCPSGPHPLPFGWKAAQRLSTGLDSAWPSPHLGLATDSDSTDVGFHRLCSTFSKEILWGSVPKGRQTLRSIPSECLCYRPGPGKHCIYDLGNILILSSQLRGGLCVLEIFFRHSGLLENSVPPAWNGTA